MEGMDLKLTSLIVGHILNNLSMLGPMAGTSLVYS